MIVSDHRKCDHSCRARNADQINQSSQGSLRDSTQSSLTRVAARCHCGCSTLSWRAPRQDLRSRRTHGFRMASSISWKTWSSSGPAATWAVAATFSRRRFLGSYGSIERHGDYRLAICDADCLKAAGCSLPSGRCCCSLFPWGQRAHGARPPKCLQAASGSPPWNCRNLPSCLLSCRILCPFLLSSNRKRPRWSSAETEICWSTSVARDASAILEACSSSRGYPETDQTGSVL